MTLTEQKRLRYLKRYVRKDARTLIYAALYGKAGGSGSHSRRNDPALDETRRLPYHWTYLQAEQVFNDWIDTAMLSATHKSVLHHRLEQLRHHKPHEA